MCTHGLLAQGFSALATSKHSLQFFAHHSYFSDIL